MVPSRRRFPPIDDVRVPRFRHASNFGLAAARYLHASRHPVERPSVVRGVRLDHGDLDGGRRRRRAPRHGAVAHIAPRRRSPPYPRTWSRHGVPKGYRTPPVILPYFICHTTVFHRLLSMGFTGLSGAMQLAFARFGTSERGILDMTRCLSRVGLLAAACSLAVALGGEAYGQNTIG